MGFPEIVPGHAPDICQKKVPKRVPMAEKFGSSVPYKWINKI